jgi:RNA polymerase sigma-70 factor (ECF subfamily)
LKSVADSGNSSEADSSVRLGSAQLDLTQIVVQHQAMVWRYLRALGADAALADDLTQDTFLEILRHPLEQYSDSATASYLRRVAHNLFISRRRRDARMLVTQHAEEFETAWIRWAGFDSGNQLLDALKDCFSRLTERAQLALRLRFDREATRQGIAEQLGISEHGAKNLMQRAKAQLRECLEKRI